MTLNTEASVDITKVARSIADTVGSARTQKLLGVAVAAWSILKHYDPTVIASLGGGYTVVRSAIESIFNSPKGTPPTT